MTAIRDLVGSTPRLLADLVRLATPTAGSRANAWRAGVADARRTDERARLGPGAKPTGSGAVLEALSEAECWEMLDTAVFGRLAFTAHSGAPVIVPVNHVVDGHDIVLRTGHGPKRAAALRGDLVAFEVDDIDPIARSGRSVVVTADARVVEDPTELSRLRALSLQPWAAGPRDDYVVLTPRHVAGRRLISRDRTSEG